MMMLARWPRRAAAISLLCTLACLLSREASGDGGAVRLQETAGPFVITVFTAPEPLHVGRAEVSVLVQDQERGEPILDADVLVQLSPPASPGVAGPPITAAAAHAEAINKLLYAAVTDLPAAGTWELRVGVRQRTVSATVGADLSVRPGPGRRRLWPYLAFPPAAILLFVLHQLLAHRQRREWGLAALAERATGRGW